MATTESEGSRQSAGVIDRMFREHPRSLGMSWAGHGVGAVKIAAELIGAGCACMVHAAIPGWFTQTAGKTVERMHDHMINRRAGADDPEAWPEYEI
jgi:Family of unknown function (DUF6356)